MTWPLRYLAATAVACSPLRPSVQAVEDGRYPDAIAEVRRLEPRARSFGPRRAARYALYRGVSHLAVGDAEVARLWLECAWHAAERDRGVLDSDERARLELAWRSLGYMPAERRVKHRPL